MNIMHIQSRANPVIKYINSLKTSAGVKKEKETLLEGERLVCDSALSGAQITSVLIREDYTGRVPDCEKIFKLEASLFDKTAETVSPQGIMATARAEYSDLSEVLSLNSILVCDNMRDPGNMGTLIRTVAALKSVGIVLTEGCTSAFNTKTVRSSMSAVFKTKIAQSNDIEAIKAAGFKIIGSALSAESVDLFLTDLKGKCAFIIGNEANGVSRDLLEKCDKTVVIPMPGGLESLNASVAGGIILYEHFRQNR